MMAGMDVARAWFPQYPDETEAEYANRRERMLDELRLPDPPLSLPYPPGSRPASRMGFLDRYADPKIETPAERSRRERRIAPILSLPFDPTLAMKL
jgi:hypothetical protein